MDYNKKGVKWYWWTLLIAYAAGVVYFVLWSDPYLYSNIEFQKALVGRKSNTPQTYDSNRLPGSEANFSQEAISQYLWSPQRTGVDPTETTRNRRFMEETSSPLDLPESFEPQLWASDSNGLVMVGAKGKVAAFNWEGALLWKFTPPEAVSFFSPLLLKDQVILATRQGHLYSLQREDGDIQWYSPIAQEIFSTPILREKTFLIALRPFTREIQARTGADKEASEFKDDLSPGLAEVDLRTGSWLKISEAIPFSKEVHWSLQSPDTLYLSSDRGLYQVEISSLTVKRKKEFEAEIVSPVMVLSNELIVPTRDGRVFNLKTNFEPQFETDLGTALNIPPIYIPLHDRVALITENGYLHVLTAKKGERKWRFNLQNESPSPLGWASRLNGRHIEQLNLGWGFKGWSLWVPCVKDRVCIYNPVEGQIIDRILLSGAYMGTPYIQEKSFYFILKKDNQWKISRYIERPLVEKTTPAAAE